MSYGPVQVLFDVSLQLEPGELVALVGTNGAGKTTLLRTMAGLLAPDRGAVRLAGADITTFPAAGVLVSAWSTSPAGSRCPDR